MAREDGQMAARARVQHPLGRRRYPDCRCKFSAFSLLIFPLLGAFRSKKATDTLPSSELCRATRALGLGGRSQDPGEFLGPAQHGREADYVLKTRINV